MNTDENLMVAVPDPDLEIGGVGGGGSSRPLDKIGGAPPPPNFRRQFGLKIRGGGGRLVHKAPPAKNWTWVNKP